MQPRFRRHLSIACLVSLLLAVIAPGLALAKSLPDDRISETRAAGAASGAIGMVIRMSADGTALGTGFLVSPCHVLTAAHVVGENGDINADQVLLFFAGTGKLGPEYLQANSFGAMSPARPLVWGESHDLHKGSTADRRAAWKMAGWDDWALLKLDRCLGDQGFGYLKLLPMTTTELTQSGSQYAVTSVGFPADQNNDRLTVDPACNVIGQVENTGWQHDCTSLPGNSGGPILSAKILPGDAWPRVMAISVIATSEHGDALEPLLLDPNAPDYLLSLPTAVPVAAFLPKIAPFLPPDPRVTAFLAKHPGADRGYDIEHAAPAVADFTKALQRQPHSPQLLTKRGLWLEAEEDQDAALVDYSAALKAEPNYAPALYARALLRRDRNDKMQDDAKLAKDDFDRLIARFPEISFLRVSRGMLLFGEYDYRGAMADFDAGLAADPDNISAKFTRANARVELGDMDGAGKDYDDVIAQRPDDANFRVQRAYYLMRVGKVKKAFADIEEALKIEPEMPYAISARASMHLDTGNVDAALADADAATALDPKVGGLAALRGTIKQIKGDLPGAIADYRTAGKLDPTEAFDPLLLFVALSEAGKRDEAEGALRDLLKRWPETEWPAPLARRLLGEIDDAALMKAAAVGTEVLRKYQDFDWHFYLGAEAMIAGDTAKARSYFDHVVDTDMRQFLEYSVARVYLERLGGRAYLKTN